jgi:hypothetical protein
MQLKEAFPNQPADVLRRFSIARSHDVAQSTEMLSTHIAWREANLPIDPESCAAELAKCKVFTHGFDNEGRPIVYWWGKRHDPSDSDLEEVIKSLLLRIEEALQNAPEESDGKFVLLLYLSGPKHQFDVPLIKRLAPILQNNYPERLHRALIYPGTTLAQTLWTMVKYFINPITREKIVVVPERKEKAQRQQEFEPYISKAELIRQFGGERQADEAD